MTPKKNTPINACDQCGRPDYLNEALKASHAALLEAAEKAKTLIGQLITHADFIGFDRKIFDILEKAIQSAKEVEK